MPITGHAGGAAGGLPNIETKVGADPGGFIAGMALASGSVGKFKTALAVGAAGVAALSLVASGAAAKMAVSFDKEMTRIITLVGVAEGQVDAWRESILALAPAVGRGPRELARAMFVVTSAGERGAEAMEILETSAKASAIGLGETAVVARTITAAMQAFENDGLDAAEAGDVLVATVREGNLEASELAGSLGQVIGLAGTLGVSFQEVGAFIATYTRLGVNARIATTALRSVMTNFVKGTVDGEKALAKLGLSLAGMRQEIKEKGLTVALIDLLSSLEGNIEAVADIIPNVRALVGVLGTAGVQAESYKTIIDSINDSHGDLLAGFERFRQTPAATMDELKAKAEQTAIAFGQKLIPILDKVLNSIISLLGLMTKAIEAFSKLPDGVQQTVVSLSLLATILTPVVIALGGLAAVLPAVSAGLGLLAAPTALVVVSVAAAAVGLWALVEAFDAVRDAADISDDLDALDDQLKAQLSAFTGEQLASAFEAQQKKVAEAKARVSRSGAQQERIALETKGKSLEIARQDLAIAREWERRQQTRLDMIQGEIEARITAPPIGVEGKPTPEASGGTEEGQKLIQRLTAQERALTESKRAAFEYKLGLMEIEPKERLDALAIFDSIAALEAKEEAEKEATEAARQRNAALDQQVKAEQRWQDQLRKTAEQRTKALVSAVQLADIQEQTRQVEDSAQRMSQAFGEAATDIFLHTESIVDSVRQLVDSLIEEFARLAARELIVGAVQGAITNMLGGIVPGAPGAVTGVSGPSIAVDDFADTGVTLTPPSGSMVMSSSRAGSGGGGPTIVQHVNFSVSTIDGPSGRRWLETEGAPAIQGVMRNSLQDSQMLSRGVRKGRL